MFTDKDKALHKGLIKILDEATFQLKAREVNAFVQVYTWAKDLDKKETAVKPAKKKAK